MAGTYRLRAETGTQIEREKDRGGRDKIIDRDIDRDTERQRRRQGHRYTDTQGGREI